MNKRAMNFYAGPAALPLAALERARDELVDFDGTGMSLMEHSHRGPAYDVVHREALSLIRELMGVPESYHVLLLQGGARQQFAMIPMNLLHPGKSADYVVTGNWGRQALGEAKLLGEARAAANTEQEGGTFHAVPTELDLDPDAAYLHLTSNNTLFGTQWASYPETGGVPLIADMTSDMISRPIDVSRFGLIYAGAQKNLGPAGVTVVIVRKDLVEGARKDIPNVFRYASFAAKDSLWNTPPTFPIYMLRNTLDVIKEQGGAAGMAKLSEKKSGLLYERLDAHPDFFRSPVGQASRSLVNVVFRLPTPELEQAFLAAAAERSMIGLKGHRIVGGIRASLYNHVQLEWVEALGDLMDTFRAKHG